MLFPTITFAVFFLLVFVGNWLLMPSQRVWKPFIIVVSYVFYGWWDWRFVFLLVAHARESRSPSWYRAPGGGRRRRRARWPSAVAANLGALGFFKYFDFFAVNLNTCSAPPPR